MKYVFSLLLIGSLLSFAACGTDRSDSPERNEEQSSEYPSGLLQRIEDSRRQKELDAAQRTAKLELRLQEEGSAEAIAVDIWLINPDQKPITSVRSFLTFDSDVLSGTEIAIPQDSPFTVVAPGEQQFDADRGLAKIGLSTADNTVVTESEQLVATVFFKRQENTFTTIDFYNPGDNGHTLVLEKTADGFRDVLQTPSVPTLLFLEQQ